MKKDINYFLKYLIAEKVVSGPLINPKSGLLEPVNNSTLGKIKKILVGDTPFLGGEHYLVFGSEFHSRSLEPKLQRVTWTPHETESELQMREMVKAINRCKLFTETLPGGVVEKTIFNTVFGVPMRGTIDLKNKVRRRKRIIDLKTTSEITEAGFIKKAMKIDYPRQGFIYEQLDDADEVYIIGVCKKNLGTKQKPHHPVFIFDLNNYEKEKRAAEQEAYFLLKFYEQYGIPEWGGKIGVRQENDSRRH